MYPVVKRSPHIFLLAIALATSAAAGQRVIESPAGEFGGGAKDWNGNWATYEPAQGVLEVKLQPAEGALPEHLQILVSSHGENDTGSAQQSSGLFRAINPNSRFASGETQTIRFQLWVDDVNQFKARGSLFGFSSTDTPNIASLSSRSTWNLICFGARTDIGGVSLQAGELGLRVMSQDTNELTTIPTGVLIESGMPTEITYTIKPAAHTFDVRISQGTNTFERSGLGYWTQKPDLKNTYINGFFSTLPSQGFTVNLGGLVLDSAE